MVYTYSLSSLIAVLIFMVSAFLSLDGLLISLSASWALSADFNLTLDSYSLGFGVVVSIIACGVMMFCGVYMKEEVNKARFSYLVLTFVLSMMLLLFSGSMLSLMIGWDGLGLVSFLLVIYYESKSSLAAGMLTAMTNRVGDVLFILSMVLMSAKMTFDLSAFIEMGVGFFFSVLLVVGSITKSAHVPFSAWLPAAMAAPTPVSTLVHSSTLVTAGLFVVIRFESGLSKGPLTALLALAALTCLMAGACAIIEPDLKKVVALSTLSQLGVIGVALGAGDDRLAFFHLSVHALFKALMFMCVGCYIMSGYGVQEARSMSGLYNKSPLVSGWLIVSCLSLSGFPFTAGFFSKDLILEGLIEQSVSVVGLAWVYLSCTLTSFYSCRLVTLILMSEGALVSSSCFEGLSEVVCTSLLGVGSVAGGLFLQNAFLNCNLYCEISSSEKVSILGAVSIGCLFFLLSVEWDNANGCFKPAWAQHWSSFMWGEMFFMRLLSGSLISRSAFNLSHSAAKLEAEYDFFLGEGSMYKSAMMGSSGSGQSLHFGVWVFFFYYSFIVVFLGGWLLIL